RGDRRDRIGLQSSPNCFGNSDTDYRACRKQVKKFRSPPGSKRDRKEGDLEGILRRTYLLFRIQVLPARERAFFAPVHGGRLIFRRPATPLRRGWFECPRGGHSLSLRRLSISVEAPLFAI